MARRFKRVYDMRALSVGADVAGKSTLLFRTVNLTVTTGGSHMSASPSSSSLSLFGISTNTLPAVEQHTCDSSLDCSTPASCCRLARDLAGAGAVTHVLALVVVVQRLSVAGWWSVMASGEPRGGAGRRTLGGGGVGWSPGQGGGRRRRTRHRGPAAHQREKAGRRRLGPTMAGGGRSRGRGAMAGELTRVRSEGREEGKGEVARGDGAEELAGGEREVRQVFHGGRGAHEVFAKIPKREMRRKKEVMLTCGPHLS